MGCKGGRGAVLGVPSCRARGILGGRGQDIERGLCRESRGWREGAVGYTENVGAHGAVQGSEGALECLGDLGGSGMLAGGGGAVG